MDASRLKELLKSVASGRVRVEEAVAQLKRLPFEDLTYAQVDHHRSLRKGFPEVVFGEGKTGEQILGIAKAMVEQGDTVMVTRLSPEKATVITAKHPNVTYHRQARILVHTTQSAKPAGKGLIDGIHQLELSAAR